MESHPAPTFVFIDPFGFSGIPYEQIKRLLCNDKCEVLITFMVDSINRFLANPGAKPHIVEAFGTDKVVRIAESGADRVAELRLLYQRQLQQAARFVRYFEMCRTQSRPFYYLFFASNHPLGHVKMKEAMWGVDPGGEFRFSDATDPSQLVLFETDPIDALARKLHTRFDGKGRMAVKDVRIYVEEETAYLAKHMRKALKQEEAAGRVLVQPQKRTGERRRANTYQDDAIIEFVALN